MMQKEEILKYAGYPKSYAASLLNVTMSDLTKMCQNYGKKFNQVSLNRNSEVAIPSKQICKET
jgi:hypothetical protein